MLKRNTIAQTVCGALLFCSLPSSIVFSQDAIPEAVAVEGATLPAAKPLIKTGEAKDELRGDGKLRPLTVSVELSSQAIIAGTLVDVSQVQMKTSFGEASIPMSEIAGIRFASGQDNTTTVVMLNGDSITGAVDLKVLSVETEWGSAKINGSAIQSLLFVPDLKWVNNNGLNGRRWFLVEANAKPNAGTSPNQPTGTFGTNPNGLNSGSSLPAPNQVNRPVFPGSSSTIAPRQQ